MEIFNINGWEMIVVVIAFLMLFGPEKLPEVAMQIGRFVREVREASQAATSEISRELRRAAEENQEATADIRSIGDTARRMLQETSSSVNSGMNQAVRAGNAAFSLAPDAPPPVPAAPAALPEPDPDPDPDVAAILADVAAQTRAVEDEAGTGASR